MLDIGGIVEIGNLTLVVVISLTVERIDLGEVSAKFHK
jgi:hypothetical protein